MYNRFVFKYVSFFDFGMQVVYIFEEASWRDNAMKSTKNINEFCANKKEAVENSL